MPRADSEEDCQWQTRAPCAMDIISGAAGKHSLYRRALLHRDAQRLLDLPPEQIGAEPRERPAAHACSYREVFMLVPRSPPLSMPPDSYRGLELLVAALPS